jgi:hypothetical protein
MLFDGKIKNSDYKKAVKICQQISCTEQGDLTATALSYCDRYGWLPAAGLFDYVVDMRDRGRIFRVFPQYYSLKAPSVRRFGVSRSENSPVHPGPVEG